MELYFISDTHFSHTKLRNSTWESAFWKKYDEIAEDFILFHLGDLAFIQNHLYLEALFNRFRANKHCKNIVLILGNHDGKASKYLSHNVIACKSMIIRRYGREIILTHKPVVTDMINIHGHLHTSDVVKRDCTLSSNNILIEEGKIYSMKDLRKIIDRVK